MTLIYLVRHGETEWNRARRVQGSTDIPLNDTGRAQAATTGRLLARMQWTGVVASPLSRAYETASIIASALGLPAPSTLNAIVERNYGEAEGFTDAELRVKFPDDTPVPGRESREAVAERAIPALIELAEKHHGGALVVVSHGGVIRSVLATVAPASSHEPITNGSIHSFRHRDGSLELIAFDDPIEIESLAYSTGDLEEQNPIERRDEAHAL